MSILHLVVDVTAQVVSWLSSCLSRNCWTVLIQWSLGDIQSIGRIITWVSYLKTVDSGDIHSNERWMTWYSCISTPESSLNLIIRFNWISTESWLRQCYKVEWAISSESVWQQYNMKIMQSFTFTYLGPTFMLECTDKHDIQLGICNTVYVSFFRYLNDNNSNTISFFARIIDVSLFRRKWQAETISLLSVPLEGR